MALAAAWPAAVGSTADRPGPATHVDLGDGLVVAPLADDCWVHTSRNAEGIPANGLLVSLRSGTLLVDTAWDEPHPEARKVVPGHGAPGGTAALARTLELLEAIATPAPRAGSPEVR